jgi:hypothetical protein
VRSGRFGRVGDAGVAAARAEGGGGGARLGFLGKTMGGRLIGQAHLSVRGGGRVGCAERGRKGGGPQLG